MRGIPVVLQSNLPKAFIQKKSQSPNTQSRRPMSPAVGFYVTARTSILIQCFCGLEKNEGWMFADTLQGTYRLNNADWKLTFRFEMVPFQVKNVQVRGCKLNPNLLGKNENKTRTFHHFFKNSPSLELKFEIVFFCFHQKIGKQLSPRQLTWQWKIITSSNGSFSIVMLVSGV